MLPQEIIIKKRKGLILSKEDINIFVNGLIDQSFSDSQAAAMTMAILLNDMNNEETANLTQAMSNSGVILNWKKIIDSDFICDKHSTGGVGDKVSLLLAPILAACGGYVPMISGRGLGHTGGTLDKFDSIPGYNTQPSVSKFQKTVKEVGCAIIGQTPDLAPADKRLYAIRDVVGTVESIPLITSSILSKKISSGINTLVIDVKVGNGSFNPNIEIAKKLSNSLVNISKKLELKCTAVLTDMNQILGANAGHSLEVIECIEYFLNNKKNPRLQEITNDLCAELLCMNNPTLSKSEALKKINEMVNSGQAAEKFEKMVSSLGGSSKILSNYKKELKQSRYSKEIFSNKTGYIESIDTRMLGLILIELGGGRKQIKDKIDYSVGFADVVGIGDSVDKHKPILRMYARSQDELKFFEHKIQNCFDITGVKKNKLKNIYEKVS